MPTSIDHITSIKAKEIGLKSYLKSNKGSTNSSGFTDHELNEYEAEGETENYYLEGNNWRITDLDELIVDPLDPLQTGCKVYFFSLFLKFFLFFIAHIQISFDNLNTVCLFLSID